MATLNIPDQTSLLDLANAFASVGLELILTRKGVEAVAMAPTTAPQEPPKAVTNTWLKANAAKAQPVSA